MSRRPTGRAARSHHRQSAGQALLFDDTTTEHVLRTARDPGYVHIGINESVYLRDTTRRSGRLDHTGGHHTGGHVVPVGPGEAATVLDLLDSGRLHHGTRTIVTIAGRPELETATTIDVPATATGPAPGDQVRVFVDVVRPGHGLVTADTFSGQIVRQDGTYLVETDAGEVIGRARSFRSGAERLARHHGLRADPVEVDHEHRHYGAPR